MTEYDAFSRRGFVKLAGALGVGTVGASGCATGAVAERPTPLVGRLVPERPFGRTGARVSMLALGGYFDVAANFPLLTSALAAGVTYWETTLRFGGTGYGEYFRQHPGTRERVFLMAKAAGAAPEQLDRDLSRVLSETGVDRIDFFLIQGLDDPARLDDAVQRWVAGEKARGRIRYFGFSTHANMARCLEAGAGLPWIDGAMTSYNYRLMQDAVLQEAITACHERGIALTAIKSQALPTNPQATLGDETEAAQQSLQSLAAAGLNPFQLKLKAVWSDPRIASICSMMTEPRTLRENVLAASDGREITAAAQQALDAHGRATARGYCLGCSDICEPTLGRTVPIAALMRGLMYARGYGDRTLARAEWSALTPAAQQMVQTSDYASAEARCPQGLAIGDMMRATRDLLV
jgi:uncharacterized protein